MTEITIRNRKKRAENAIVKWHRVVVFLAVFVIYPVLIPSAAARYIKQTEITGVANAREFYFVSDLLDGGVHQVSADTEQTASVTLILMNYEENFKCSEVDIDYEIAITDENGNEMNGVTVSPSAGKIKKGKFSGTEITVNGLMAGHIYRITASTDNTYRKTLTGTVCVAETDNTPAAEEVPVEEEFTDSAFPEAGTADIEINEDFSQDNITSDASGNYPEDADIMECEPGEENCIEADFPDVDPGSTNSL